MGIEGTYVVFCSMCSGFLPSLWLLVVSTIFIHMFSPILTYTTSVLFHLIFICFVAYSVVPTFTAAISNGCFEQVAPYRSIPCNWPTVQNWFQIIAVQVVFYWKGATSPSDALFLVSSRVYGDYSVLKRICKLSVNPNCPEHLARPVCSWGSICSDLAYLLLAYSLGR